MLLCNCSNSPLSSTVWVLRGVLSNLAYVILILGGCCLQANSSNCYLAVWASTSATRESSDRKRYKVKKIHHTSVYHPLILKQTLLKDCPTDEICPNLSD